MDLTGDAAAPTAALDAEPAEDAYAEFLDEMERLGLLHDLEDELPPDFSAVFEIGRILASPAGALGRALASALELRQAETPPDEDAAHQEPESRVQVPAAEEYEAEFIRTWRDVQHVYSWQWLLPEEVFLRRLAQRTLWFPMAKAPRIRAIEGGDDGFLPSPTKQKVYVLLDTSASMALHHRFPFAKAVVLKFLRENRREMGEVFLRTFDVDLGPLESASDGPGYEAMVRRVARRRTLGNGTCLERAVLQACADIRERKGLAGAEILVVTDGAAHVDTYAVEEALGRDIELHVVKIGNLAVSATSNWVSDQLEFSRHVRTPRERKIVQIRERRERLKLALPTAHDADARRGIQQGIDSCNAELHAIGADIARDFGHEIESLAHVYVQVPDLDPAALGLTQEQLASLERLVRDMLERLRAAPAPPSVMKQAALLLSHVALLSAEQQDPAARDALDRMRAELERELTEAIGHHEERVLEAGLLSPADQRDLRVLLRRGVTRYSSLWLALLRYFYAFVARLRQR